MRIGFFGGCFNPPTNIHVDLARKILVSYGLDKVYFVPVGDYYSKEGLIEADHRAKMLNLAVEDDPKIEVERIAVNSKDVLYAIDTFELIQEKYKYDELFFIMGSDNFRTMPIWKRYERLISDYNIIVIERQRKELRANIRNNIFEYIPERVYDIDSTKIRQMIKEDNPEVKQYLDDKVYSYIKEHNLYKERDFYED